MIRAVRVCFLLATLFLTSVAFADVQTLWSQRFTAGALTYSVKTMRFDPAGHLIVAGEVIEANTGIDIWVAKLNKDTGALMWTFRRGGVLNKDDKLGNIAITATGDVYVAGALTNDMLGPSTPDTDLFLAFIKSTDGSYIWERNGIGNPGEDGIFDVALDGAENPVITGTLENVENGQHGEVWTAKFDKADGGFIWDRFFRSFDGFIQDQGERLFIAPNGDVFVQGWTAPATVGGEAFPPAVLALCYKADGTPVFERRFRDGPNIRAYGFIPNVNGGFVIGFTVAPPQVGFTIHTVANNRVDGSPNVEVQLPGVASVPLLNIAEDGDVLYSGRGPVGSVPPPIVSGRLKPADFQNQWTLSQPGQQVGTSTAFGHAVMGSLGTVVAGISPGPNTPDLLLAFYSKTGAQLGASFVDGAFSGAEVTDQVPGSLSTDSNGDIGVAVQLSTPTGQRELLIRRVRFVVNAGGPVVTLTSPDPANLNVDAFADFRFAVNAIDLQGGPLSVEFFADGKSIGVVPTAPFEVTHRFDSTGTHTLNAVATSARSGLVGTTGPITVVAHVPVPVVTTGGAERTGPDTGLFHASVSNLPLGGTAKFLFQFSGPTIGFTMSTGTVTLPPNTGAQAVSIPFVIPQPHRSYDYFLEVTATDGTETRVAPSSVKTFTVPNAPVVASPDFVFTPRGAIAGSPIANDSDGDPGETLTVTYGPGPYPGKLVVEGNNFAFIPDRTFTGELVLNYTVDDGNGSTTSETLVIRNGLHYAGNYRALSSPNSSSLGAVDVVVNRLGRATATFYLDGDRYAAAGELKQQPGDRVGLSVIVKKRGEPDRLLRLLWEADRAFTADLIEDDYPIFNADGIRAGVSAFELPKVYTMLGTHNNVSGNAGGKVTAFGSLRLPPDGKATFRGRLGDGTPFVATARVQEDGRLPVFARISGRGRSFVIGRMQVNANDAVSFSPGIAAVMAPATGSTPAYAGNYRDLVTFTGPLFEPSPSEPPLTFTATPRRLTLSVNGGGQSGLSFDLPVWLGRNGSVSGITGITRFSLNPVTGEMSGAFLPTGARRTVPFGGIIRPGANSGIGIFRGPPSAGEVQITPQ